MLASGTLTSWLRPFTWSDVVLTWARGLSGGRLPYWDTFFEYPPLVGYISAAFSVLAPTAVSYVLAWAAVQAVCAAAIALVLVGAGVGGRRIWLFALAPELALLGPINFDLIAVLTLVLAVRWARAHAPLRSAAALALGTVAKLFPLALLPMAVLREPARRREVALRLCAAAVIVAAFYAPAAAAPYSTLLGIGRYSVGSTTNFDSIWGLVASGLRAGGVDPSTPILVVTSLGLVGTYAAFVLPLARSRDPAPAMALAVITVLLWSRLYSPQYSLWVIPLFALIPLPSRAFALLVAGDLGVFLTVYPITLTTWPRGDPVEPLLFGALVAAVVVRHAALVLAWLSARRLALTETSQAAGAGVAGGSPAPRAAR